MVAPLGKKQAPFLSFGKVSPVGWPFSEAVPSLSQWLERT